MLTIAISQIRLAIARRASQHCSNSQMIAPGCLTRALGLALFLFVASASAQQRWPRVALPESARSFEIGEQITVNGLPMRLQGFMSETRPAELLATFRQTLGKPMVENALGNKLVIGRADGDFYITVQIEPAGKGSKGLVAITDLKGLSKNRAEMQNANVRWLNRLPSGSKIMSQLTSEDVGKVANHLVIVNGHSEDLNSDVLKSLMREDAYQLERESTPDAKTLHSVPGHLSSGKALFFKGTGKEAMAVIARDTQGRTSIVLHTVTPIERVK
jgi:hypothetical protein